MKNDLTSLKYEDRVVTAMLSSAHADMRYTKQSFKIIKIGRDKSLKGVKEIQNNTFLNEL